MFHQDPSDKFRQDLSSFNFGAALRTFISDNITFALLLLGVCGVAAISNGAKGVLTNRRIGTVILVIMVCRAFHSGATANSRIIIRDVPEDEHDSEQDS